MTVTQLPISTFIEKSKTDSIIVDVRSPSEYQKGHIPSAINIPILDDEERKKVGTLYKQNGREEAVLEGLDLVGGKLRSFVEQITRLKKEVSFRHLLVHCARGGLRSSSFAWLTDLANVHTLTLKSGYKAYRNHVLETHEKPYKFILLDGATGSGKTDILKELKKMGEQVIDLEGLAHHKGSVFGGIGQKEQPTTQQFENNLAEELKTLDSSRWIWLENESPAIGSVRIPQGVTKQMKTSPVFKINIPAEERAERIIREYGHFDPETLEDRICRIRKYVGGENCDLAVKAVRENRVHDATMILLAYYDKTYNHYTMKKRENIALTLDIEKDIPEKNAEIILKTAREKLFN